MAARQSNVLPALTEFIVMLLGGFLVLFSLPRVVSVPSTALLEILGAVLVYWALRAWMRKEPASARLQTHVRAGSLAIVGLLMITMPFAPMSLVNLLMILAGVVLMVRGLAAGLLMLRRA
jgi:hypothetical protein